MSASEWADIVIVEDNPTDLEITLRALKKHNLANRVKTLRDGAEALDFLFARGAYADRDPEQAPRVILLDLKLPKVDGLEVLRALKENPATRTIPVVVLTSSAEERDRLESYRIGVNSYIVKPVEFDTFVKAVADVGLYWLLLNKPSGDGDASP